MSNTCFATYKVTGSKESVTKLHSTIKELDEKEKALVDNDWYNPNLWLGCLVKALGGEPDNVNCRGYITSYKLDQDVLTLTTETAWVEMAETRHFLESCFPSMKIYFIEEEYGEEIFRTNDIDGRFFKDRYYLDASEGSSYFETLVEAAEYISVIVGHKVEPILKDVEDAVANYVKSAEDDDDMYMTFHEFKILED